MTQALQIVEWNLKARGDDLKINQTTIDQQQAYTNEERKELVEAKKRNDTVEIYDAIADIFYTQMYLAIMYSKFEHKSAHSYLAVHLEAFYEEFKEYNMDCVIACIDEIIKSNFTKLIPLNEFKNHLDKPNDWNFRYNYGYVTFYDSNNKIMKPASYVKPDLVPILGSFGILINTPA